MPIYEFEGKRPTIAESAFVHPMATVIGEVAIGENCYVGAGAVIRGDWGSVTIGAGSNIQENCVLHGRSDASVVLAADSHIGHGAILHGCKLGHHVLVGMGAVVDNRVNIGDGCIIGAGAVILADTEIPDRKVVVGVPAKVIGDVSEAQANGSWRGTRLYQTMPDRCCRSLKEIE